MFKIIRTLLLLSHLIAERESKKQVAKQKKYRADQAALAAKLRKEADAALAKADALRSQVATANAKSALGCNKINEAERNARYLAASLSNFQ